MAEEAGGKRVFQAEGTAGAEAQRHKQALCAQSKWRVQSEAVDWSRKALVSVLGSVDFSLRTVRSNQGGLSRRVKSDFFG